MSTRPLAAYEQLLKSANPFLEKRCARFFLMAGMGYGEWETWWRDGGQRPRPHEGVDLCCFRDDQGEIDFVDENCRVPLCRDGDVVAVFDDYHAQTLVVCEGVVENTQLLGLYAHLLPSLRLGGKVMRGAVIGGIAPAPGPVPAHLHLSRLRLPLDFPLEDLDWSVLNRCGPAIFLNPFGEDPLLS